MTMANLHPLGRKVLCIGLFFLAFAAVRAGDADPLATLRAGHPRLLFTTEDEARLRTAAKSDPTLAALIDQLRASAEATLTAPPVRHVLVGPRMLAQSRTCLTRVLTCALAFRLTGEPRFADRAKQEMLTAAAFPDWNPSHFLDVAEMATALAIGYDWLYPQLTAPERATIRQALLDKALVYVPAAYASGGPTDKRLWWVQAAHNWNQVCNGGLLAAALALADEEPALARTTVLGAQQSLVRAMDAYLPDGAYPEGPGYWEYGTTYNVLAIAMLESALQQQSALARHRGLAQTARYRLHVEGPAHLTFNYADGSPRSGLSPAYAWLADRYQLGAARDQIRQALTASVAAGKSARNAGQFSALNVIWFPAARPADADALSAELTALRFRGPAEIALFRSSWRDSDALFVGFKAGSNAVNHSHLDLGSFVLDADGVRWAHDLGPDNYDLPGYFNTARQRWQYFRLNNHSHNTVTPGDRLQKPNAVAPLIAFANTPERAVAVADLAAVYPGAAEHWWRGVGLLDRSRVLVADEWRGRAAGEPLHWRMVTSAAIKLGADGRSATLTQNGRTLRAEILGPTAAAFTIAPATPPRADERQNQDMRILSITLPSASSPSDAQLFVLLSPVGGKWPASLPPPPLAPPSTWPDHTSATVQ